MLIVYNPATGEEVGRVAQNTTHQVKAAVDRACAAFPAWSSRLAKERSDLLRHWHDAVKADKEAFAELLCRENGKCLSEARGEIDYGLGFIEWYAEEAKRVYGDTIPTHDRNANVLVTKEAIGPVAAITPWNFPFMMITRKVATALAAGCTMVIKPAEDTPLTAFKLLEYARKAGIPEGVLEVVAGDPREIGLILTGDPRIRKISFTGSTGVGKLLAAQCAASIKKMTLELGGNAPFIVFQDADLDEAVKGLVGAKLRNSGQVCISPNRIFVQHSILEDFIQRVQHAVAGIEVDQGLREGFVVGPLVNQAGFDKVVRLVEAAKAAGASVLMGGRPHAKGGLFYEPTVLTGLRDDSPLATEEIFGPVFAIYSFKDEEEVIARANQTEFGLVAYAYTSALGRSLRLSCQLEAGMVILNSGSVGTASVPFGGIKQSGYGREGSYYGIEEYVQVKYVLMGGAHL
ncbi:MULTISPECIES: NAD-dependent succinate-semialdehyde dehydrogenase [unclassified Pseudomonas]|uniref:NAD-dependent succinate-semialdehyde dehydrogenase n=1 Tax=unclassified Pseudomonas TaxID=196821 RepID=UPI0008E144C4|nr:MULTISPECIES: NAD-dependent succinate-semialdehyde dehydrogenase [unclassified Pseudomonas]PMV18341.1 NAD-dependent succinate-semialdehyde dehydrogenase [Pseudomonas sp. FW305-3-2-15-C-TSA2]PMV18495.1 NAD-dependent succinate-semialdehyde dehydrogenase [Pseudomonas sp. DP16D-L5]PMV34886.1 NAD-dependent succinate-semialdehyde dehydrogenase [Pseudomonas sp. FW305-3-2-15-A-LB2]PMV38865.1 NAD-dependent succinate-semialdehyde dehydrogenase [Pseudomonas sp. FW305-3-2-15-C-R2A1]PMV44629.1 NAD-depen